jgi:hypothetical protein
MRATFAVSVSSKTRPRVDVMDRSVETAGFSEFSYACPTEESQLVTEEGRTLEVKVAGVSGSTFAVGWNTMFSPALENHERASRS